MMHKHTQHSKKSFILISLMAVLSMGALSCSASLDPDFDPRNLTSSVEDNSPLAVTTEQIVATDGREGIYVSWPHTDADDGQLTGYRIYRAAGNEQVALYYKGSTKIPMSRNFYFDANPPANVNLIYFIYSLDRFNRESADSLESQDTVFVPTQPTSNGNNLSSAD